MADLWNTLKWFLWKGIIGDAYTLWSFLNSISPPSGNVVRLHFLLQLDMAELFSLANEVSVKAMCVNFSSQWEPASWSLCSIPAFLCLGICWLKLSFQSAWVPEYLQWYSSLEMKHLKYTFFVCVKPLSFGAVRYGSITCSILTNTHTESFIYIYFIMNYFCIQVFRII